MRSFNAAPSHIACGLAKHPGKQIRAGAVRRKVIQFMRVALEIIEERRVNLAIEQLPAAL